MKKKLLVLSLAAILAAPAAFAAYTLDATPTANTTTTDDPRDLQTVTIKVPEVALLDVGDAAVDLNETGLVAPTNAGDGFSGSAVGSTTYAISSNVLNTDSPTKRKITVSVDTAVGKVPAGATLAVAVTAPTGGTDGFTATNGTATLTNTTATAQDSATNIANVKGTGLAITYTLQADAGGMIAHTGTDGTADDNIGLIFTLSDDT
jgi:hypothetical protein